MKNGLSLYAFGTQRSFCSSRSQSSSKCGKSAMSSIVLIFAIGSNAFFCAHSSQNGDPVSGEKCHFTISRRCASSFSFAAAALLLMSLILFPFVSQA